MLRAKFAYDVRHVAPVHYVNAARNVPREEHATRDVTFGPLCIIASFGALVESVDFAGARNHCEGSVSSL
jgi:hypothetical protein